MSPRHRLEAAGWVIEPTINAQVLWAAWREDMRVQAMHDGVCIAFKVIDGWQARREFASVDEALDVLGVAR